jgi:hypothetical protein
MNGQLRIIVSVSGKGKTPGYLEGLLKDGEFLLEDRSRVHAEIKIMVTFGSMGPRVKILGIAAGRAVCWRVCQQVARIMGVPVGNPQAPRPPKNIRRYP